ncbi:MAG: HAMP domain-containing histidine kinase [Candidatus Omnitrophica bacterium]|nr:HAMP domain-containing histidine kinase [Candidatus Omnitrophota bacterium]
MNIFNRFIFRFLISKFYRKFWLQIAIPLVIVASLSVGCTGVFFIHNFCADITGIERSKLWISLFILEVLAFIIAVLSARIFSLPIRRLSERIKRGVENNEAGKISVKRYDEIGDLARVFNELADKIEEVKISRRFSSVGQAAIWVAHELKNSLAPIKSFIQMFPERYNDAKFRNKFNDIIPKEIGRFERMLQELSDFAFYSDFKCETLDIRKTIEDIFLMLEEKFRNRKIDAKMSVLKEGDFYAWADLERIKQVFLNLFINAADAMPVGGRLLVSLDSLEDKGGAYIRIRISDTGVGIAPENLNNIFEPFCAFGKKSTGLGLAISKRIIEQHKGFIRVESRPDQGTVFIIDLPSAKKSFSKIS